MRKLAVAAFILISCLFVAAPKAKALNRSTTPVPRHIGVAVASKSRWVLMYGDSHFRIGDNTVATLFVEKGSLIEYKQTGVWPQSSAFLLRLKQVPVTEGDASRPERTLVVDIAYKNNPATQQWESYAVSWRYNNDGVKNPTSYHCKGLHAGCSERPAEDTPENGGPDFL